MQWPCVGEDLVALTIGGSDDKLIAVLCESLDASPLFRSNVVMEALPEKVSTDDSNGDPSVQTALIAHGGTWATECFCIMSVTDGAVAGTRAVGVGSNVKKRTRAGRAALAVALEIQERWGVVPELAIVVSRAEQALREPAPRWAKPRNRVRGYEWSTERWGGSLEWSAPNQALGDGGVHVQPCPLGFTSSDWYDSDDAPPPPPRRKPSTTSWLQGSVADVRTEVPPPPPGQPRSCQLPPPPPPLSPPSDEHARVRHRAPQGSDVPLPSGRLGIFRSVREVRTEIGFIEV